MKPSVLAKATASASEGGTCRRHSCPWSATSLAAKFNARTVFAGKVPSSDSSSAHFGVPIAGRSTGTRMRDQEGGAAMAIADRSETREIECTRRICGHASATLARNDCATDAPVTRQGGRMRWMVGIDIRHTSAGAVALARAMRKQSDEQTMIGVHVIEDHARAIVAEFDPEAAKDLPARVEKLLEPLADDEAFADIGTIPATAAEDGLVGAAKERACDGYIIGRRGPSHGRALVRLGRVARRMLRTLDRPVIVVPPDWQPDTTLDGPILLLTALGAASSGAARLTKGLSLSLGTDVLVSTAVEEPTELDLYLPRASERAEADVRDTARDLEHWIARHDLADARHSVVSGPVSARMLEVAKVAGASMIVVGSRGLTTAERIFVSSLGSHLAAVAPLPVAVVPPSWHYPAAT